MGLMDKLLKTESRIRKRVENMFGAGAAQTPLEVRREILEQVESRVSVDKGGKVFPFGRILIRLEPQNQALQDVFTAAFLEERPLENDIRELLNDSGARFPESLEVVVESSVQSGADGAPAGGPIFSVEFIRGREARKQERPSAGLVVVKGTAEQKEYPVTKDRMLMGRLAELLDKEGQMVRRNDVVFLDNEDEINSTIGRAHATVYYDRDRCEYRVTDEVSRYGTRIFREGRTIEVPGGNPRGVRLHSGDEIYLGRACLRFESE